MAVVSTIPGRCRQCYSCVRHCPVKAIMVREQQATVLEERCISCGHCVTLCSQKAKRVASDLKAVREMLAKGRPACALLAPSFVAEFCPLRPGQVAAALRRLGFRWVYEVAYGAELVTGEYQRLLRRAAQAGWRRPLVSTPCPAVVHLVERHFPSLVSFLAPVVSPMVATARAARVLLGDTPGLATVFIGPCVAKIEEARHPEVGGAVDGVLGFPELRGWWQEAGVDPSSLPEEGFDNPPATLGKLYPVPGGLLRTAALRADVLDNEIHVVEGREKSLEFLRALERREVGGTFVDILFCEGCVSGPLAGSSLPAYGRRDRVVREVRALPPASLRLAQPPPGVDLHRGFTPRPVLLPEPDEGQIRAILRELGKTRPEDELNCGACGYATCRDKAVAVFQGLAENKMCLPYLITELQNRNAELAYLRDYNRNIVESIAEGVIVTDREATITVFNDPRGHLSDHPRAELIGCKLFRALPHLDREEVRKAISAVLEEGRVGSVPELRYQLRDRPVVSSLRAYPLRGEQGALLGAVVICQDITEEKRWFTRLAESDRLASLGRLAAGVAHEINNPLTLVSGYAELLRDGVSDPALREQATVIVEEVERIAGIVRNLLTFARQQRSTVTPCDVSAILGRLVALTASQFQKAHVEQVVESEPGLPVVAANPSELEQVFLNLMINALEAMPDGGTLSIRARAVVTDGVPWVEVRFADTGCGIREEHLDRIFEPFFTTKEVGKGTGLGLSVSYGIVRKYGGTIEVSSEEGKGSEFVVRLPVADNGERWHRR